MNTIIITDTHFGVNKNSKVWCDYQLKFIDNTLIPLIRKLKQIDDVRIVHCGDVFDSKSTYSLLIANRVVSKFAELLELCPVIIIAGNHDFYSMTDDTYCTIPLLFDGIQNGNLTYCVKGYLADEQTKELFLPYFSTENEDELEQILQDISFKPEVIYCHTDLEHSTPKKRELLQGINVISGHIHSPIIHDNYYTIGSTYPLTFADSNTPHGCYVMDGTDVQGMKFIENNDSIKFWRRYNAEIFDDFDYNEDDYIELYIDKDNLTNDLYINRLKSLSAKYHNLTQKPIVPVKENVTNVDVGSYDIVQTIRNVIDKKYHSKLDIIVKSC